jgi:hypothetical protein
MGKHMRRRLTKRPRVQKKCHQVNIVNSFHIQKINNTWHKKTDFGLSHSLSPLMQFEQVASSMVAQQDSRLQVEESG